MEWIALMDRLPDKRKVDFKTEDGLEYQGIFATDTKTFYAYGINHHLEGVTHWRLQIPTRQQLMPKYITVKTIMGDFNYDRYRRLRRAYIEACKAGAVEFSFESTPCCTAFIGVVLEYLQPQFANK